MKLTALITMCALLGAAPSIAQQTNDATSQSYSQSGVHNQGDTVRALNFGGNNANSTAPCVLGYGAFGVSLPMLNKACVTQGEALILTQIADMRNGPAKQAAIYHFCANTPSMRSTMIAIGWCVVGKR